MLNNRRLCNSLFIVWTILVLVLLLLPNGYLVRETTRLPLIPHADKVVHFCLFGGFCFFMYCSFRLKSRFRQHKLMLLCLITTILYGFLGEVLQLVTNTWLKRTFTWSDLIADTLGGLVVLAFLWLINSKKTWFLPISEQQIRDCEKQCGESEK